MPTQSINIISAFNLWLKKEFIQKKFLGPWVLLPLILIAVAGGALAAYNLFFVPFVVGASLLGIIVIFYCIVYPLKGFYIINFLGFFVFYPNHIIGRDVLPLNTVLEVLILFIFFGTVISKRSGIINERGLSKTFISITLSLLTVYVGLQAFNPNVYGLGGWFVAFKRSLIFVLIYIAAYRLIDTEKKFNYFVRFWIIMSLVASSYGCFQQWFGYLAFEMNYIRNISGAFEILNQGGQLRKFSFLADVVSFGVLAGCMALFTLLLAINEKNTVKKTWLFLFSIIMALGMSYSGTRTVTIIIPTGLTLYCLLRIKHKTTLVTIFLATIGAIAVLFVPIYDNATLNRVRSTFDTKDPSLDVRNINRHYIQPYMQSHPLGGGIGTTNNAGLYNHPGHQLAGFATDSGFLKAGLEIGWIGLILIILFNLSILYQGINYYFKMKDKQLKLYVVVIVCTLFANIVTQYAQETVGQFPFAIFFFSSLSLMKRLFEFDKEKRNSLLNQNA